MVSQASSSERIPITSYWLTQPVTFDGQITSPEEWSDATPVDLTLLEWQGPGTVSASFWVKNDATWLYILERAEWPAGDIDAYDGALIGYFWGKYVPPWQYSDLGCIGFDNYTWDGWGWNDTVWKGDTTASPPGGSAVTDYAIVELYYDTRYGRPVLLVAGISGVASRIVCEWLNDRTLDGTIRGYDCSALVLRIYDEDVDPFVTRDDQTVTVAESA